MALPRPSPLSAFTTWRADPVGIAVAVGVAVAYVLLVRRVRARGHAWPAWRSGFALVACAGLVYLTCGWVGSYARVVLYAFTVQVTLLLVVAPALFAFGRPLTLLRLAFPRLDAPVGRVLRSRAGRIAASPATGPVVIPVVLFAIFFTGLLGPLLLHAWASELMVVALLAIGFVVAFPLGGDDTETSAMAIALGIFLGIIGLLLDAVPGIVLRLATNPVALHAVTARHAPWGPDLITDQQRSGAVLWFLGEVLDLPFLGLMISRWVRADAAEARRVDAELDAAPAEPVSRPDEPELQRPWWETDPSRLGAARTEQIKRNMRGT